MSVKTAHLRHNVQGKRNLDDAIALLPTPRASDGEKGGPNQRGSSGDLMLPSLVMLLPTPTARDHKGQSARKPRILTDGSTSPELCRNNMLPNAVIGLDTPPPSTAGRPASAGEHQTQLF